MKNTWILVAFSAYVAITISCSRKEALTVDSLKSCTRNFTEHRMAGTRRHVVNDMAVGDIARSASIYSFHGKLYVNGMEDIGGDGTRIKKVGYEEFLIDCDGVQNIINWDDYPLASVDYFPRIIGTFHGGSR